MKYLSKNCDNLESRFLILGEYQACLERSRRMSSIKHTRKAFTLAEVMTALVILSLICSGVLVVINRCAASAADTSLRMQAFEVARENMEKVLISESVEEGTDFGESEKNPQIKWQTAIETFYEPITSQMWVKAVCTAEYSDSMGQTKTVKLEHWLAKVTDEQMNELMGQEEGLLAEQIIKTIEDAAQYAQVDVQTIEQWLDNGLLTTDEGAFFKHNLDIYKNANGQPGPEEKDMQISTIEQLLKIVPEQSESDGQKQRDNVDPTTGLPYENIDKMGVDEIFDLLKERKR
jgi:prepilin-type N-terminal cleavage/methylation domain-containing protein